MINYGTRMLYRPTFFLKASKNVSSLEHVMSVIEGRNGVAGRNKDLFGRCADHTVVDVPLGTIFRNLVRKNLLRSSNVSSAFKFDDIHHLTCLQEREIVAELTEEGSMFLAAKGGAGGKGNAAFKSSVLQAPMLAEEGAHGETFTFDIGEFKHWLISFI